MHRGCFMTAECPRVMRARWDGEDNGSHAAQSHGAQNTQKIPLKTKKGGKKGSFSTHQGKPSLRATEKTCFYLPLSSLTRRWRMASFLLANKQCALNVTGYQWWQHNTLKDCWTQFCFTVILLYSLFLIIRKISFTPLSVKNQCSKVEII